MLRIEHEHDTIRITQIDPGRVETEEFSLVRFGSDAERARAVYEGELNLTAEDVAETVRWIASLPERVNIDRINIMARGQL